VEYQVGDKVVYPGQGITQIVSITEEDLGGMKMVCYNLRLLATESKVVVPVANADKVGLRTLTDTSVVSEAMDRLRSNEENGATDWKDRYRANLERIKTGQLGEIVDVILCLANVAARKTLSFRERKMFDHARQMLSYEVAEVEGRTAEEVELEVENVLDKLAEEIE